MSEDGPDEGPLEDGGGDDGQDGAYDRDADDDGWSPVLAMAFGPMVGMVGGMVVGILFLDDLGRAITIGFIVGMFLGTMVYTLLSAGSDG